MSAATAAGGAVSRGLRGGARVRGLLALAPFLLFCAAFLVVPLLLMLVQSVRGPGGDLTLSHFGRAFAAEYRGALLNSLVISVVSAAAGTAIGGIAAWAALHARSGFVRRGVVTLANVTSNFAGIPLAFAFIATLGTSGFVTAWLDRLVGLDLCSWGRFFYKAPGVTLAYVYFQLPLMILVITPALRGLRTEWAEAAASLGASRGEYFRRVALPVLAPSLLASFMLLCANALGAYATAFALAQDNVNLLPIKIGFLMTGDVTLDQGLASALAVVLVVLMALLIAGYQAMAARGRRWLA
ncbi:MAG: ABC transporter permease subunit [Deltaproteobacteria bacterium]|nr:ABC transporter permease subunit [Deltaproteobacteria bacterium]